MEVERLLNEDVEETFIPSKLALDSNDLETLVPPKKKTQPSQQASQKRGCKSNSLTPSKLALNSNSSETPLPLKKKAKGKGRPTLSSGTMDPLPPIDPSAVHSKEMKNPIALALMTGSQARTNELKANNKQRKAVEVDVEDKPFGCAKRAESKAAQTAIAERAKFAQELALGGKTPEEVSQFLNAVFPPLAPV
ncbi:hypothetical protein DFH28DRAFT_931161 [Melampsora americana]|nr:hypothetical protein DFH28DRAFT_931161 [Melampsora americana]